MPYIEVLLFTKWVKDADGEDIPNALSEIGAWALANGEYLPQPLFSPHLCGMVYHDVTSQANVHQRILDNLAVFVARVEMTVPTAQHFASDNRIWTLGYWRRDDEGGVLSSNWSEPLTVEERQRAVNYITSNSAIEAWQLAQVFDATDTRQEIAAKLKAFFKE